MQDLSKREHRQAEEEKAKKVDLNGCSKMYMPWRERERAWGEIALPRICLVFFFCDLWSAKAKFHAYRKQSERTKAMEGKAIMQRGESIGAQRGNMQIHRKQRT